MPVGVERGHRQWLVESLIPYGSTVVITDLADPEPGELIAAGFDVVLQLHCIGECDEGPVLLSAHWRDGLVPGHSPPAPFWVERTLRGFQRAKVAA